MKTEQQQYNVTCCYLCSTADKHRKNKCGIMNLIYFIVDIFFLFFVLCLCVCMSSWCTLSVLCVLFVPCRVSTKGSDRFFVCLAWALIRLVTVATIFLQLQMFVYFPILVASTNIHQFHSVDYEKSTYAS